MIKTLAEMQKQLDKITSESENLPIPERPDIKNLGDLPLRADYRAVVFFGVANGDILTKNFSIKDFEGRIFVLKSIRLVPYTDTVSYIDAEFTDVSTQFETIPPRARINRLFDEFLNGAQIDFILNGVPIGVFPSSPEGGFPGDLFLDEIYFRFSQKLVTFDIKVNLLVYSDIVADSTRNPFIKVVVECYLL